MAEYLEDIQEILEEYKGEVEEYREDPGHDDISNEDFLHRIEEKLDIR